METTFNIKLAARGDWRDLERGSKVLYELNSRLAGIGQFIASGALLQIGAQLSTMVTTIPQVLRQVVTLGANLNHLASQTGISESELLVLQQAFKDAGVSAEQVGPIVNKLQMQLANVARNGSGPAAEALDRFGLKIENVMRMSPSQQFAAVAKGLAGVESPTLRAAYAMALFGEQGAKLMAIFRNGGALEDAARSLGELPAVIQASSTELERVDTLLGRLDNKGKQLLAGAGEQIQQELLGPLEAVDQMDFTNLGRTLGALAGPAVATAIGATAARLIVLTTETLRATAVTMNFNLVKNELFGPPRPGLGAAMIRLASTTQAASGLMGRLGAAVGSVGTSLRLLYSANPLGFIATTLGVIVGATWQWFANQRQVKAEATAHAAEMKSLMTTHAERIGQLEDEAQLLDYIAEKQKEIIELEKQNTKESREKAKLIKEQVAQAQQVTLEQLRQQRIANQNRRENEAALVKLDELTKARTAPASRAAEIERLQAKIATTPEVDGNAALAEIERLRQLRSRESLTVEWQAANPEKVAPTPSNSSSSTYGAVSATGDRAKSIQDVKDKKLEDARREASRTAFVGDAPTQDEIDQMIGAQAKLLEQEQERRQAIADLARLQKEQDEETAQRREALRREELTGLDLQTKALEEQFARGAVAADAYRTQRLEILDEQRRREREALEAHTMAAEAQALALSNLDERYRQERLGVEQEIQDAIKRSLDENWAAHEAYYQRQLAAIDEQQRDALAANTPEAIAHATALQKQRLSLIEQALTKAKELNEASAQAGLAPSISPVTGEAVSPYGLEVQQSPLETARENPSSQLSDWDRLDEELAQRAENWAAVAAAPFEGMFSGLSNGLNTFFQTGKITWEGMRKIGQSVFASFTKSIADMAAAWITKHIVMQASMKALSALGSMLKKKETTETIAQEAAKTPIFSINALLSSIGSFGVAAIVGLALVTAAMAAMGAFYSGGYTGPGGKYEPAGVVHKGEIVFSQEDVARAGGVAQVEKLRKEGMQQPRESLGMLLSRMAGFRDGGVVGEEDVPLTLPRVAEYPTGYPMSKYLAQPLVADPWAAIEDYLTRNNYAPELPSASQQLTRTQIFVVGTDAEAQRLKESIPGEVEIRRLAQEEIRRLRS